MNPWDAGEVRNQIPGIQGPLCGAKGRPAGPAGASRLAVTALGSRLVACVRQYNPNGGLNPFCTARMESRLPNCLLSDLPIGSRFNPHDKPRSG